MRAWVYDNEKWLNDTDDFLYCVLSVPSHYLGGLVFQSYSDVTSDVPSVLYIHVHVVPLMPDPDSRERVEQLDVSASVSSTRRCRIFRLDECVFQVVLHSAMSPGCMP